MDEDVSSLDDKITKTSFHIVATVRIHAGELLVKRGSVKYNNAI